MILAMLACAGGKDSATPAISAPADTPPEDSTDLDTRGPLPLARLSELEDLDLAEGSVRVALTAAPHAHRFTDTAGATHTVDGFAYSSDGTPLIRAQLGDTFTADFTNSLAEPTTIHWHGLAVPFEMDGVIWKGAPIQPGERFTYTFPLTEPGTFWFHPHFNTDEQVSGGLYGVLIVEDPSDPAVDEDLVLLIDDWDLDPVASDMDDMAHDHVAAEGTWTVNGQILPTLTLDGGKTLRVRMLNVSNLGYLDLTWPDIRQLGSDQGIAGAMAQPDSIVLGPGDRLEAEWLIGTSAFTLDDQPYVHQGGAAWGEASSLMDITIGAPSAAPSGLDWPFTGLAPTPDPGHTDITYVFSGSRESGVWLMNGAVFPNIDIDEVTLGDHAIIEVRNLSPAEHPYHLHGMPFEVLSIDGTPPATRRLEDTLNLGVYSTVRLRIEANNPGDWMSHCHILPHAEGGMMTVLRVSAD